MVLYKGQSRRIKDALVTLLADVQLNSESAFVSVQGSTDEQFDGFPSVRVLPGQLEDEKGSVRQNDHTVAYIVRIYSARQAGTGSEESQINTMYDLTDLVMDTLDQAYAGTSLTTIDPLIRTYTMTNQQGEWTEVETEAGILLMTDINVRVSYVKNLS